MASLVAETQLEKDVASNAGVIPIWPWLDEDGKTKDGLPPNIYANMLLQEKRANGQDGAIIRCHHDGCEPVGGIGTKAMFWRSADTPENIVPEGWPDFGGPHHFVECPNCRARDIQEIGLDEFMEDGRVDINLKHGSTGSTGASDKALTPLTVSPHIPTTTNTTTTENMDLKAKARELWKNYPEHLEAVLKRIDDDAEEEERKKRANAAEDRKRKKDDEEYFKSKKKRTKGGKRRRKKRTKKRRKSRRRKRRRKNRKKRTKRRR